MWSPASDDRLPSPATKSWLRQSLSAPPSALATAGEPNNEKRASMISIFIITFFYLCCGCFGYAAFGNGTPGNLLTGFGFYEPFWLIDFAKACIVLHLILRERLLPYRLNLFRLCFRTVYVATTPGLAMFFPFFNEVIGALGALNFWPLVIYFPVEMYFVQKKISAWGKKWIVLKTFSIVCLLLSIFALIGSLEGVLTKKIG